jgi:glycine/D-amino acid oxidase-like deaminating enzyme
VLIGGPSYWFHEMGGLPAPRPSLPGGTDVDVAVVGAGYTGLWTAYYLKRADPSLRIAILEREVAGYGASGRNGGWVSGEIAFEGDRRTRLAVYDTVDEVGRVCAAEGIDCDFLKGGSLSVATNEVQLARLHRHLEHRRASGDTEDDARLLERDELEQRIRLGGALAAVRTPHCARVQPAALAVGLAAAVERLGVVIHEHTPVREILPGGIARTDQGDVRASWVVRATEGYTASIRGRKRRLLPMNSSMIATEPLTPAAIAAIGWDDAETIHDLANAYVYIQRTADDRIALGGRGVPYRFGSRTDRHGEIAPGTVASLERRLRQLFPQAADTRVAHGWSGVLGVPRDWQFAVGADPHRRVAWSGGYVGVGVAAANLGGRIVADLVRGERSDLVTLPFVGHAWRRDWEPEPLRYLGVTAMYSLYRTADRREAHTGRPSRLAGIANKITGRKH